MMECRELRVVGQEYMDCPWETVGLPSARTLFECPGAGWHDESYYCATDLFWWDENWRDVSYQEQEQGGWLCRACIHSLLDEKYGHDSPEMQAFYANMEFLLTLDHELKRRSADGEKKE